MTEHILSMLGLALKAGRVEVGEEPVGSAARGKKARVIFVAQDAAPSSVRRAQSFARAGSTLCVTLPAGKDQLGRSLGRTNVAMCAVTDIGFAEALAKKLAALDSGTYQEAADTLAVKAAREKSAAGQKACPCREGAGGAARSAGEDGDKAGAAACGGRRGQTCRTPQAADGAAQPAVRRCAAGEKGQGKPEEVRQISRTGNFRSAPRGVPITKMEVALFG